ncbi:hypothetical protein CY35_02G111600 [Sphagnum magellanicum]|nr:hypothetical protein CY35_02G111600 [Sphagnum magellanicum]
MSHHHHHHHHQGQGSDAPYYGAPGYGAPGYGAPGYGAPYYPPGQGMIAPAFGEQSYSYNNAYGSAYPPVPYGGNSQMMPVQGLGGAPGLYQEQQYQQMQAQEHRHRQNEHRAEVGALGTAAFAAYELHEEKVDPAHAHRHHMEAQAAEAATLGLGGYALYEHHEANKIHKAEEQMFGHRQHHKHGHHHR